MDRNRELRFKGIPEVQINVVKKDKAEIANVYMGISIGYSGKGGDPASRAINR